MNEKIVELSDINSVHDSERGFSLTQSQRNNIATSSAEGDALFNLSENVTSLNRSTRQQTMLSKPNNTTKDKKLKCDGLFRNLKKITECLKSTLNYIYCLTGKNIRLQVGVTYSILLILLTLLIILLNITHIFSSINSLADKKYFLFYVNNIIDTQREIKAHLDEINNHDLSSSINEPLLFLRIYTEEMVENNILKNNTIILEKDLQNMYEELGENYILSKDLNELAEISVEETNNDIKEDEFNIKNMLPFYFHFSPILIENLNNCGIKLNNFYFIANEADPKNENRKINSMYFKYPLDNIDVAPDVTQQNNKIFDFILDPYTDSTLDFEGQNDIINSIRLNNWFYNCVKDENTHFRIFKINKLSEEKIRQDYLMVFSRSDNLNISNDTIDSKVYFTFSMKIKLDENELSFIKLNENKDILFFDYFSLYNFEDDFKPIRIEDNKNHQNFEIDYDLDSSKNILLKIPKFISNIHTYSMFERDKDQRYHEDQAKLLKYQEIENIEKYYDLNIFFEKDSLIFKLIYFLNEFFLYKRNHPDYLTKEYNNSETSSDHPCIFQGTDEYYEKIKSDYDYDCLDDFCLYNNCDQRENKLEDLYFMPNCYCIPLFCRDSLSLNTDFHQKLKNRISNINSHMSENGYAFTSSYKDYLMKKEYNFSTIDEYFNRENFEFNCKLNFGQKNNTYNNFFRTKIKIQNLAYKSGDSNFLMFFMNNNMTSFLVNNLKNMNLVYFFCTLGGYTFFLIGTIIFLVKYILIQVNNLLNRMETMKKIRKALITNEEEKDNLEEISSSNNNIISNNDSTLIFNDDNLSMKSNDSFSKKIKNEKEKENEEKKEEKKVVEMDELDTLIKLINENLADFQIKFNLNEDMNSNINEIKKQYNGIIKINQYKNKLLMNKENNIDSLDEEEIINSSEDKEENLDNLSLKMFYELLSTSTTEMDFSNIKRNFYYKKHDGKLLFGLNEIFEIFSKEDSNGNGEITNLTKIQNAINYYYKNIHNLWEKDFEEMKKEEDMNI